MKRTIWKYELELYGHQTIEMPLGSHILTVQSQKGNLCIWALVDPDETETEERTIEIYTTGRMITYTDELHKQYIGTVQLDSGDFIAHIFEVHTFEIP